MRRLVAFVFLTHLVLAGCGQNESRSSKQERNLWLEARIQEWKTGTVDEHWDALAAIAQEGLFKISERDTFALSFLHERSQSGDEPERETAIKAMGFIRAPDSLPLIKSALKDESFFVRKAAVWALGRFDDPSKTEWIIPLLDDENGLVRQQAAHALKHVVPDEKLQERIVAILNEIPQITIQESDPERMGKAIFDAVKEHAEMPRDQKRASEGE